MFGLIHCKHCGQDLLYDERKPQVCPRCDVPYSDTFTSKYSTTSSHKWKSLYCARCKKHTEHDFETVPAKGCWTIIFLFVFFLFCLPLFVELPYFTIALFLLLILYLKSSLKEAYKDALAERQTYYECVRCHLKYGTDISKSYSLAERLPQVYSVEPCVQCKGVEMLALKIGPKGRTVLYACNFCRLSNTNRVKTRWAVATSEEYKLFFEHWETHNKNGRLKNGFFFKTAEPLLKFEQQ